MGTLLIIKWGLLPKAARGKLVKHDRSVVRLTKLSVNGLRKVDTCKRIRSIVASWESCVDTIRKIVLCSLNMLSTSHLTRVRPEPDGVINYEPYLD